jgi:hypothetical protein
MSAKKQVLDLSPIDTVHFGVQYNKYEVVNVLVQDGNGTLWPGNDNDPFDGDAKSIKVNGIASDATVKTESWAIVGPYDLRGYKNVQLDFWHKEQYKKSDSDSKMEVLYSSNFDNSTADSAAAVTAATWSNITDKVTLDNNSGKFAHNQSLIPALDSLGEKVYIGFKFSVTVEGLNSTNARSGTHWISEFVINGEGSPIVVEEPVLIRETEEDAALDIYPNPTSGLFYVNECFSKVELISLSGQVVKSVSMPTGTVDVSALSKGLYVVRLTNPKGESSFQRLLVK